MLGCKHDSLFIGKRWNTGQRGPFIAVVNKQKIQDKKYFCVFNYNDIHLLIIEKREEKTSRIANLYANLLKYMLKL